MRQALEEMYPIVEEVELDEAKYELYHKDFSSAMQHAYHVAKKHHGITIDPKEIDDKVATGPSKPSEGKTNKYRLKGDKGAVQIQVYNKGGSKPFELNMYKEEVDLDEGTKQVLAHGGKGQYKAVRDGDITKIMYKGKVVGTADFDSGADSFFASIKGEKGQRSFDDAQAMVDYFAKKKITEEVELDEKEITLFKSMQPTAYDRMRRRMNPKDIKTVDASDEKQIKDLESRGWHRSPYDEEVDLDEGGMKDLLIRAQELMGPSKNRKEGIQMVAKGLKVSEKEATKLVDAAIKMNEEVEIEEGAAADARRAMKKDKDFSRRDRADDDDSATDADVKAASKNIMMQLRKAGNRASQGVEFADGKKVKIPAKMAIAVQSKYNSMKKPADKEKFQARIGKSYKDMLSALKEELQPQKESILERMNRKIKENKNG